MKTNVLYYGDNLEMLRRHIPDESVDLIYLDPPFNSNRSYNVLFKESTGAASEAQIEAFEDAWKWGPVTAKAYEEVMSGPRQEVARMLRAMVDGLGHNDVTAYLSMMAVRLIELHRVLKPTGSIYLHCDPTASHYLKVLMDAVFLPRNFVNEILWKRFSSHGNVYKAYGKVHDILLFYRKAEAATWNQSYRPLSNKYVETFFRHIEPNTNRRYRLQNVLNPNKDRPNLTYEWNGHTRVWKWTKERMQQLHNAGLLEYSKTGMISGVRQYLDESLGEKLQDVWDDIRPLGQTGDKDLGYNTQKPLALLERVITASSNEGDIVLDPFCGCGTAVHAAQKLGRRWIGIDITYLAIGLVRRRMQDAFPGIAIEEIGAPVDLAGARALADHDKYQFQWWALDRLGAQPVAGKKKGADKGIDGVIPFFAGTKEDYMRVVVSVKGGEHVSVAMVRDLVGVLQREKEPIGVLLTLVPPTKDMVAEAAAAGFYYNDFWKRDCPRIQIITVEEMLAGKRLQMPPAKSPFVQAPVEQERVEQGRF